jgi:hypothetical protein
MSSEYAIFFNTWHIAEVFWPELEVNSNFHQLGENDGKKQTFLTPGDHNLGRFKIHGRVLAGRRGLPDRRHAVPHLQSRRGNDRAFPVLKSFVPVEV